MLKDGYGREITYMRISVTDRCNLRCVYCMPQEGIAQTAHREILTFDEIVQIVRIGAEEGISRIKITGGEPLVRKGIAALIGMLKAVPGIEQVTNDNERRAFVPSDGRAGKKRIRCSQHKSRHTRRNRI